MKLTLKVIGWILIALQVMAYIGAADLGNSPFMLNVVGFIAFNILGIIGFLMIKLANKLK